VADLFLSYARPDRVKAEALASALEARGYSVWWDRHIKGGSEFSADIERQLLAAKVVLVAWSESARESPWVKDEAGVGRERGTLVALSFDGEPPPLGFRQYHAVDFSAWKKTEVGGEFQLLLQAIESRIQGEPSSTAAGPLSSVRHQPGRTGPLKWAAAIALAVAAFAAITQLPVWQSQPAGEQGVDTEQGYVDLAADGDMPRVSVAQFKSSANDPVMAEMASALSEGIANGLSRFSWLQVASQSPAGSSPDAGVAYRLDGSLRQSGDTLRLTVQLFKTATGEQVWGESYDRPFDEGMSLVVQDDLTANVVASVADSYGSLMRDLSEPVALKSPEQMSPYEAVLRHLVYRQRLGPDDHKITLQALERAVQADPNNADAWSALAAMYTEEYKHDYNQLPGSLDRALQAARQALELEPDNAYGTFVLAEVYYFRQNLGAFRASAERAIKLNPYDSDSMAMIGILRSYGGEWALGTELAEQAMSLNPNHPGWYRFGIVFDELRRGDFEAALETAQRINLPLYFADPYARALAHAYLGQMDEARLAAQEFMALWPYDDLAYFEEIHLDRWFYASPELISLTIEGLEMAGMELD
jgi:TolB-like protein/cytochrome c-type biogenesis protein CcmH/NrfG